jgi:hypothetical protein
VLLVVLVALVSLTLSAVVLIQSVSGGTLTSGALATRQTNSSVAEYGINAAMSNFLDAGFLGPNSPSNTYSDQAAYGYLAHYDHNNSTTNGVPTLLASATSSGLTAFDATYAPGSGGGAQQAVSSSGGTALGTFRYLIERMCDTTLAAGSAAIASKCVLWGQQQTWTQTHNYGATAAGVITPTYRITVRVDTENAQNGANFSSYNSTSFTQVMMTP